ncbi:MAG: winged helix-turn-helix domain-containing protein [Phycisphaeraceae bacterium]|nr:MAG: winged helix-turn-helix domain-containing protein [Phycisphaeraceae bacterium]
MSKKTPTTKSNPASKATRRPAPHAAANDKARAEALAKLNAKPDATAKDASKRGTMASTSSAPKPATKTTARLKPKRLSALDAAAQVLQALPAKEARLGLSASELIERMAAAGLWTSPGGKTPAATLYAAMMREILAKGDAARFVRLEATDGGKRGRFTASSVTATVTRQDHTSKVRTQKTPKPLSRKGAA